MTRCYDDIIFRSRPRSLRHSPMSRAGRAAQFAPFAALSGYDGAIAETARLTDPQSAMAEDQLCLMDEKLHALLDIIRDQPEITITFFEPDAKKVGGAYLRATGRIRRIDETNRQIIFADRTVIAMDSICEIDCSLISSANQ